MNFCLSGWVCNMTRPLFSVLGRGRIHEKKTASLQRLGTASASLTFKSRAAGITGSPMDLVMSDGGQLL
ncbi:hypothetical protein TH62_19430 [Bacillus sp. TH008]|nr:hypothetical protein TH62_19430 [Bacillus sp. TH008]